MNGREPSSVAILATGVLSLGMLLPLGVVPAVRSHTIALAQTLAPSQRHVTLTRDGDVIELNTTAATVSDLLRERGIAVASQDYLSPAGDTPLTDGMSIDYRAAVPMTLYVGGTRSDVLTSANTVGDLLAQQNIVLGTYDKVFPALGSALAPEQTVRVVRVQQWEARERFAATLIVEHKLDMSLAPSASKVVSAGKTGVRERVVRYARIDGAVKPVATTLATRVLEIGKPQVVAHGVSDFGRFVKFAELGANTATRLAGSAMRMIATAYTAGCGGCSGITAVGLRAGFGIVAVDPSVIPLHSHLYIPGYGHALAGDTGGAIRGNRIDLGFNSNGDAMRFGRREIVVYVLK